MTGALRESFADDFGVVTGVRGPQRLSETTRQLAAKYISGEVGQSMVDPPQRLTRDDFPGDSQIIFLAKVHQHIAEHAPLRVLPVKNSSGRRHCGMRHGI